MKKKKIEDLNKCYHEAETVDSEIFSEQRSNLLLTVGEHYNRRNTKFWNRVRDSKDLNTNQKLRLTKNHIYKISKIRKNIILANASGVRILPNNQDEAQDIKSAELNQAVWSYALTQQGLEEQISNFVTDFFDIGEVAAKVYWDPNGGEHIGYEPVLNELGEPELDEDTLEMKKGRAIFSGELKIERVLAFNLLRSPTAKRMEDSEYLIYRKMVDKQTLMDMVGDDEEKKEMLVNGKDDTYVVFDTNRTSYDQERDVVTLREHYYKPCVEYPNGYFYICAGDNGILWEGELPYGIFPIVYQGHDELPTTPRHRSPLKQLRPFQIEINRAASKIAEHQVTLGDDKIVVQSGSKVQGGSVLPGVRSIQVSGPAPTILPGRSGEQYMPYVDSTLQEMYQVAMIPEALEEKGEADAWTGLFKSLKQKQKFILDARKFEVFLTKLCSKYLQLAKHYFDENQLIPRIGRSEMVNISEFKNTQPSQYQFKVVAASNELDTVMGKQLMINHILQYSSGQLDKEQIGKLIRLMPLANEEAMFDDFTMDYDRARNIELALDRGEAPVPNKYDNGPYIIKYLTKRMSKSDFGQLDPMIQQNYQNLIDLYDQQEAEKARQLKAMQDEFIPTSGAMIKVAWYIQDPTNPKRSIQATLPASSIEWLVQRLEDQGNAQNTLQGMGQGATGVVEQYNNLQQQPAQQQGQAISPNQELLAKLQGVI